MATSKTRTQQSYDHRLRELVRVTGDVNVVAEFGVPRSTAAGWLGGQPRPMVTADVLDMDHVRLQAEILKLRHQIHRLGAVIRLLLALVRTVGVHLDQVRLPEGAARARLLRAVGCAEQVLSLQIALRVLRLSPSRYHQWRQAERSCGFAGLSGSANGACCPRSTPTRLTAEEILQIKTMVMSPEYRHVSTGRLAVLTQRLGRVFAAPATWYELVRERAWRRPRARSHPAKPKRGVRAAEPDELWHIDKTVIRLIDGTKVYLHAVLDNFSRKILAWRVTGRLVAFYVASHNSEIPHSAFRGQTPDEVYYGRGQEIPDRLAAARQQARAARLTANREASCRECRSIGGTFAEVAAAAV